MRFAPRRMAGLNGVARRSAPSPKYRSPADERTRTGGNTSGMAADAMTCSIVSSTGSTTRRDLCHTGWPDRPWTKVKERPE